MRVFTNPSARAREDTGSVFRRSSTALDSKFYFFLINCLTTAEERSLPYYLPIACERIIFQREVVQCWMQSASSRIWTHVVGLISYDGNYYTTSTSRYNRCMKTRGCPRGVMVKATDCGIVVSEFVLQLCYYVHFRANSLGKGMIPLILPAMG